MVENYHLALLAWVHFLSIDLILGSWLLEKAKVLGIGHLLMIPVLVMTLLAGPLGLLSFQLIRLITYLRGRYLNAGSLRFLTMT